MTTTNKNFRVKNGLQIDPLTTPGYLINDALGNISSVPSTTSLGVYVKNNTGSTIAKGKVVYISGATGANALISLADADSELTSSKTLGLTATSLATGDSGYVITNGVISGIDTSAFSEGDGLWLSSTAGEFTTTKAVAPAHLVYIGIVTRSHAVNGEILIKVQNGYELDELHNVLITTPSNNDVLKYNSSTGVWQNGTVGGSGTVTSVGISVPAELSVSGSPITSSGTLAISYASGYAIPSTSDVSKGVSAYGWGDHSQAGYAALSATQSFTGANTFSNSTGVKITQGVLYLNASGNTSGSLISVGTGRALFVGTDATIVPITAKGATSQTANLQEWQNSSGTVLSSVDKDGNIAANSFVGNASTSSLATNISGGDAGQIPYQSASNSTSFLASGSSGSVFTSNGTNAPSWTAQSSMSVGSATTATTATNIAGGSGGQILYQSAADTTSLLAAGTAGYVLASGGSGAPSWIPVGLSLQRTITSTGAVSIPAGINVVFAVIAGGGGAGGSAGTATSSTAGGGGAGAVIAQWVPAATYAVVGAGGTPGAAGQAGGSGGTTYYSTIYATGGGGGGGGGPAAGVAGASGSGGGGGGNNAGTVTTAGALSTFNYQLGGAGGAALRSAGSPGSSGGGGAAGQTVGGSNASFSIGGAGAAGGGGGSCSLTTAGTTLTYGGAGGDGLYSGALGGQSTSTSSVKYSSGGGGGGIAGAGNAGSVSTTAVSVSGGAGGIGGGGGGAGAYSGTNGGAGGVGAILLYW